VIVGEKKARRPAGWRGRGEETLLHDARHRLPDGAAVDADDLLLEVWAPPPGIRF
jgi:hypothetical protein